jgi:eukaryotic-like serine/threonine-protein kinase
MNDDLTGTRKGDYEILGVLGAGGMGKVYKVRNVLSDRVEAMKVLLPNLAGQKDLADRFLREIKVLASLNHPNIAALRTALTIDNQLVMIMEYVEGTTLAARLDRGPLPVADALNYIDQILAALSYAHQQGVIHRDVKPANMMLTTSGTVKLMDFGIARSASDLNLTMTGTTVGSLAYMSPEQVRCEPIDARSDLYSVGVSLYELVTGQRPFQADSNFAVMQAHLEKAPKSPAELVPTLPAPLSQVILMAMAKDREQRFQTADAYRNALASVGSSLGLLAGQAGVAPAAQAVATKPGTQAARPVAATVPVAQPPAMPPPQAAASSHRGLYMALGALIVVAVLVAAGFGVPRWLHTRANNSGAPPANQSALPPKADVAPVAAAPANEPAPPPAPSQKPAVAVPAAPPPPDPAVLAQLEHDLEQASGRAGALSAAINSLQIAGNTADAQQRLQTNLDRANAALQSQDVLATQKYLGHAQQDLAGLESIVIAQLEHNLDQASSRAAAVNSSLNNLQAQQNAHGYGLRGDMVAAQTRMQTNLNRAQSALQAQDFVAAQKYLDQADRDISKLEEFIGH